MQKPIKKRKVLKNGEIDDFLNFYGLASKSWEQHVQMDDEVGERKLVMDLGVWDRYQTDRERSERKASVEQVNTGAIKSAVSEFVTGRHPSWFSRNWKRLLVAGAAGGLVTYGAALLYANQNEIVEPKPITLSKVDDHLQQNEERIKVEAITEGRTTQKEQEEMIISFGKSREFTGSILKDCRGPDGSEGGCEHEKEMAEYYALGMQTTDGDRVIIGMANWSSVDVKHIKPDYSIKQLNDADKRYGDGDTMKVQAKQLKIDDSAVTYPYCSNGVCDELPVWILEEVKDHKDVPLPPAPTSEAFIGTLFSKLGRREKGAAAAENDSTALWANGGAGPTLVYMIKNGSNVYAFDSADMKFIRRMESKLHRGERIERKMRHLGKVEGKNVFAA